jgi:hypothetical protein
MPPNSCGLVVKWLVQLETKIRNQATTKGKDSGTALGPDPGFQPRILMEPCFAAHMVLSLQSAQQASPHTSHAYLEDFMLI